MGVTSGTNACRASDIVPVVIGGRAAVPPPRTPPLKGEGGVGAAFDQLTVALISHRELLKLLYHAPPTAPNDALSLRNRPATESRLIVVRQRT